MEIYTNGDEQRMAMKIEHGIALHVGYETIQDDLI
jgi:hypothetical protein